MRETPPPACHVTSSALSTHWIFGGGVRWREQQLLSCQVFLVNVIATQTHTRKHTLLRNRDLFAKLEELICGHCAFIERLFLFCLSVS